MGKLTKVQHKWLLRLANGGGPPSMTYDAKNGWCYNPLLTEDRTFDALRIRGLVRWKEGHLEGGLNGFVITPAGRATIGEHGPGNRSRRP